MGGRGPWCCACVGTILVGCGLQICSVTKSWVIVVAMPEDVAPSVPSCPQSMTVCGEHFPDARAAAAAAVELLAVEHQEAEPGRVGSSPERERLARLLQDGDFARPFGEALIEWLDAAIASTPDEAIAGDRAACLAPYGAAAILAGCQKLSPARRGALRSGTSLSDLEAEGILLTLERLLVTDGPRAVEGDLHRFIRCLPGDPTAREALAKLAPSRATRAPSRATEVEILRDALDRVKDPVVLFAEGRWVGPWSDATLQRRNLLGGYTEAPVRGLPLRFDKERARSAFRSIVRTADPALARTIGIPAPTLQELVRGARRVQRSVGQDRASEAIAGPRDADRPDVRASGDGVARPAARPRAPRDRSWRDRGSRGM